MVQPNPQSGTTTGLPRFVTDDMYMAPGDDRRQDDIPEIVRGDIFKGRPIEPAAERRRQEKIDDALARKATGQNMSFNPRSGTLPSDTGKAERDAKSGKPPAVNDGEGTLPSDTGADERKNIAAKNAVSGTSADKVKKPEKTEEQKAAEKVRKAQENAPNGTCQFCHTVTGADANTCGEHKLPDLEAEDDGDTSKANDR